MLGAAPFGLVKTQSNVNGPVPPLADALNVHDTGPVDGATHGVRVTVKSAAAFGLPVVPVVVVLPGPWVCRRRRLAPP